LSSQVILANIINIFATYHTKASHWANIWLTHSRTVAAYNHDIAQLNYHDSVPVYFVRTDKPEEDKKSRLS